MPGDSNLIRLVDPVTESDHADGPMDAPVTLVEYGDFECPDCGRAYPVVKEIQKRLGIQLRFVFRHFPIMRVHTHALRAAEASEAAAAQGKFWPMHDLLFHNQHALEDKHLFKYAQQLGLDTQRFELEMTEHTYRAPIEEGYQRSLYVGGVTGTPTFYINDVRHDDSVNLERMMAAIERAMNAA